MMTDTEIATAVETMAETVIVIVTATRVTVIGSVNGRKNVSSETAIVTDATATPHRTARTTIVGRRGRSSTVPNMVATTGRRTRIGNTSRSRSSKL